MTHEQNINHILGECNYHKLKAYGKYRLWERVCGDNNIDYVVGLKWKKDLPEPIDFDIDKKDSIALRFPEKNDAVIYFERRTGVRV